MKNKNKKNSTSSLQRKAAIKEIMEMDQDDAVATVLPYAKDSTPYARRDLSSTLTRRLMGWNTRGLQTCMFKENLSLGVLAQTATTSTGLALSFQLNSLGNVAAYTSLFDQYRIVAVAVTATPTILTGSGSPITTFLPRLYSAIDYDDTVTPTTINTLQQFDSCVVSPPCTAITRFLQPHIALAAYTGTVFTGFTNETLKWIDVASPTVPHYGIKFVVEGGSSGQTVVQIYEIEAVVFIECKSQR